MQPHPAIPPFEPPPLSVMITESGKLILWIVGLYRAVCGVLLLGTAATSWGAVLLRKSSTP